MTPSWYDVLGVEPDASTDEIRSTWKVAVSDLDPTDRRFRLLNKAAEVLLDDGRRRAHDLELAENDDDDDEDGYEDELAAEAPGEAPAAEATAAGVPDVAAADEADHLSESTPGTAHETQETQETRETRRGPGPVLTSALGVVAALLVVAAVISLVSGGSDAVESSDALPDAREVAAARAAAEAAVVPVLAYDFRTLEEGKQAALSYMTPKYAAEYEQLFESVIRPNAPSTETVVNVEVLASGVVRSGPDLVDVLLFVDRPTVNREQTEPEIYKDQATLRMRDIGGDWLVDCVISGAGSSCE